MFKFAALYLAIALLVDATAFDSYYRHHVVQETIEFWGQFTSLDWGGFAT
ncbi:MAG: hypothetical protein JWN69_1625 [Alphaproteobacteria bacterium]|nr:hypothetical protein [Alphaproteobacteria bacterium]